MKPVNLAVLLFCLIAHGLGRPSDSDERDEILREAKKEKHFQHDSIDELPLHQTESSTAAAENVLNRLKSIAHLRMAEMKKPALDSVTREELEALRDLLDKNLQKYQNYNEFSTRKRPSDPYIGQILQNLNGEPQPTGGGNNNMQQHHNHHHNNNNDGDDMTEQLSERHQMPIRRKIIRHTVFATPMQNGNVGSSNRIFNGGDARIEWSSPWADYFPILIKDPLQTMMNSFSEIIEYGPAADICRHATTDDTATVVGEDANRLDGKGSSRTNRRTSDVGMVSTAGLQTRRRSRRSTAARSEEEKGALLNHVRPFKPTTTTAEPAKMFPWSPDKQATEHNGDTGPQIKRYRLPYWAFVPTLGVWPGAAGTGTGTGSATTAAVPPPPPRGSVAVNLDNGRVTVVDDVTNQPEVRDVVADPQQKRRPALVKPLHPNTPSVGGPSWLRKTTLASSSDPAVQTSQVKDPVVQTAQVKVSTAVATASPITKIYLKPSAKAKAGIGGVALSNPISTAVVRRGDTVSIEYLPDATAEAGEGGVAISRPELVIHFID